MAKNPTAIQVECYIYNKIVTKSRQLPLIHIEYLFNDIINHLFLWAGNFFKYLRLNKLIIISIVTHTL